MVVQNNPPVVPPAPAPTDPPAPAPEPDPVQRHTTPPQESEIVRAMKAKDAAIETQKKANETLQRALDMSNKQNETMTAMMERQQDNMAALQDLVVAQAPPDPAQPAQPQGAAANALTAEQMRTMIREESAKSAREVVLPLVEKVADISTDGDRSYFERQATTLYGVPFRLTDAQHEAVKETMVKHPTMNYMDATRFLQGDLAIQPPGQPQVPVQGAPAPVQPQPLLPGQPPVPPRAPVPAVTPPGGPAPQPPKDYKPHELIIAARNAEEAGSNNDKESILMERIAQGTIDPHKQFGDTFRGEKKPLNT